MDSNLFPPDTELGAFIKELASWLRLSRSQQASSLQYSLQFGNFFDRSYSDVMQVKTFQSWNFLKIYGG